MKRRVVVTGWGTLNPLGNTVEDTWQAAKNGTCGIGPITHYDTTGRKVTLAGEVKNLDMDARLDKRDSRKMDRYTQLAVMAADEALAMSGLDYQHEDTSRWGAIIASGIGGIKTIEDEDKRGLERSYDKVSPYFIPMAISNMAAGHIAIKYNLRGYCSCVVTACASATNAIGDAFRHIRDGYGEVMVAGGAEAAITPLSMGGFTSMHALSQATDPLRASIPFDAERNGFVMGEGAGILILEEYQHAINRGAKILGEILGYGVSCDAHHITAPLADGSGAARCMSQAMEDAGLKPSDISYVNAHGTSTPMNDSGETAAIKLAFGDHAYDLKVSSTKSMTGHLLGASGAVEAVLTLKSMQESFVLPTIGYQVADPACDLDIVPNVGESMEIPYAMSNSLGFGGHNASLIFGKGEK